MVKLGPIGHKLDYESAREFIDAFPYPSLTTKTFLLETVFSSHVFGLYVCSVGFVLAVTNNGSYTPQQ
jgi:hypothetical protein